ncbi:MAG: nucleotide exchange factor GrpE [Magnetococcales bacterium]|nr:nucleotide exchange factor GrpE [Magnetococcales bacterium]MEC8067689.1 nucleotide exchange factor GrpE [Pseudomonadota bacterium]|tara:strand:- start:26372 stop:26947 length:576 start_codon:yes stop_codon:yes gene_type:complete
MTNENKTENVVEENVVNMDTVVDNSAEENSTELTEVEKLTAERDEWKDKSYRLAAEMENVKKRTEKDITDAKKYGVTSFARELLDVQDNLERALAVLEETDVAEDKKKPMVEGVTMVKSQLVKAFDRVQIKKIEATGQKLNPELHQAVMQIPSEEEAGTVVQEIQAGYMIADRLLRPAMVGVAVAKPEQEA